MNLERLAKLLLVDEVQLWHGPKGVAVHVRDGDEWRSATIDNADLEKSLGPDDKRSAKLRRITVIAERLSTLADGHVHAVRKSYHSPVVVDAMARGVAAQQNNPGTTRPALVENTWIPPRDSPFYGIDQQVYERVEQTAVRVLGDLATRGLMMPPDLLVVASSSSTEPDPPSLPSRIHAIMEELMEDSK